LVLITVLALIFASLKRVLTSIFVFIFELALELGLTLFGVIEDSDNEDLEFE